jgi:hypothetical protein
MAPHEPDSDEQWMPVVGSNDYEVSNLGRVRNLKTGRILDPVEAGAEGNTYPAVSIERRGKKSTLAYVHQLVAEAFLGRRPIGFYTAFKDDDKRNPRAANLEYIAAPEHHRRSMGKKLKRASEEIVSRMDRRTLALVNTLIPLIAAESRTWPDFGISAARCEHLGGFAELDKKLARFELATLVRYCLHMGKSWTDLSLPPSGRKRK